MGCILRCKGATIFLYKHVQYILHLGNHASFDRHLILLEEASCPPAASPRTDKPSENIVKQDRQAERGVGAQALH